MNFEKRKSRHLRDLKKGLHHSKKLQRSWLKYGEKKFVFLILEQNIENNLIDREQYWINFYDSYKNGFNSRPDAHPVLFGKDHHGYGKQPWNKGVESKNRKEIVSYDLISGEVKYYNFSSQPMKEEGLHPQYASTFKKMSKSQGRLWFLKKDFCFSFFKEKYLNVTQRINKNLGIERSANIKRKISLGKRGKKFTQDHKLNLSKSKLDKGRCIQRSDGAIYNSIATAAREIDVDPSIISRSLSKERKSLVKGYSFNYIK
jgi:group I intron endonuclease